MVSYEQARILKEYLRITPQKKKYVIVFFKVLSQHFLGRTEENQTIFMQKCYKNIEKNAITL